MAGRVSNEVPRVTCVHISIYIPWNQYLHIYIYSYIIACGCQAPSALKPADGPPQAVPQLTAPSTLPRIRTYVYIYIAIRSHPGSSKFVYTI